MVILLGISTAIAIVVPEPKKDDPQEETTGPTGSTGATGDTGSTGSKGLESASGPGTLVEASLKPEKKNTVVRASSGDRLVLTVDTEKPTVVEIEELGLVQTTTEYAPAVFDLIVPEKPTKIEITAVGDSKPIGTIESGS